MARPENVGIHAMEIYFPSTYVAQSELERFDGVSAGRYTVGLGQKGLAFCTEAEDINSVCLTVVHQLLEKYNISPADVGRLEVGTETVIDKSKATKTTLMRLFGDNHDIEGIDTKNACYGGTQALFNSLAWVESSNWDGRYAIAVAGDIAVYDKGNARPTGGAGVVAMLIGPDAPLAFEPGVRSTHMEDVYDFYKPTLHSEYPRVDGQLSNACYLRALDGCYNRFADRFAAKNGKPWTLDECDHAIFHAPYNKLVQYSFGRYLYNDFRRNPDKYAGLTDLAKFADISAEDSYVNKDLLKTLKTLSQAQYEQKVVPSELIPTWCGNSYCGSTYAGLLSLIATKTGSLKDTRTLMFSYGSGLAASMFALRFREEPTRIQEATDIAARLEARTAVSGEEFSAAMDVREKTHSLPDYSPQPPKVPVFPGTYLLSKVDSLERREYARHLHTRRPHAQPSAALSPRAALGLTRALRLFRR